MLPFFDLCTEPCRESSVYAILLLYVQKATKQIDSHFNKLPLKRIASPLQEDDMHFLVCVKKCIIAFLKGGRGDYETFLLGKD